MILIYFQMIFHGREANHTAGATQTPKPSTPEVGASSQPRRRKLNAAPSRDRHHDPPCLTGAAAMAP